MVVPVVDLRQRFNLESRDYGPMTVVIILNVHTGSGNRTLGIVVDAVSEVYDVFDEDMRPPPDFDDVISVEYLNGLAMVKEKMLILLDVDRILTSSELAALDTTTQDTPNTA